MRLISLKIENFGKLSNTVIDLEEGLNVFLKENGWGKSTLAAFVRIMFFGFENENAKKDMEIVKERVRYVPWNGGKYGGSLKFSANGKRYELIREFKEKAGNDTFELRDLDTNLVSDDFSGNIGEELFGINAEAFSHTVFIRQRDVETAFDPSISAKIGNMEAAADDIRNFESAEERLSELLSKYDPGKKTGETGKLSKEVSELMFDVRGLPEAEENVGSISTALKKETEREAELKATRAALEKERTDTAEYIAKSAIKDRYDALCLDENEKREEEAAKRAQLPERLPTEQDISDIRQKLKLFKETENEIFVKKGKLSALKSNPEPEIPGRAGRVVVFILALLCVAAGAVLWYFGFTYPLYVLPAIPAVILLVIFLAMRYNFKKAVKRKEDYDRPIADLKRELIKDNELCEMRWEGITGRLRTYGLDPEGDPDEQVNSLENALLLYNAALENRRISEKKRIAFTETDEYDAVLTIGEERPTHTLDEIKELILSNDDDTAEAARLISRYRDELEGAVQKQEELLKKDEILREKQEKLTENTRRFRLIQKASELLKKARENYEREFTEPMKSGFDKYYSILTGEDSGKFRMDVHGTVTFEEYGKQRDIRALSTGYRDLTGLCLRMAMIDVMYKDEAPFIIFDDPLSELDDEKTKLGKQFMKAVAERYQVIWFTCREA